ncbi:2TM domain-containing protein [Brachybacterium vulturis]|uniref:2TM domain-containing protein n=1 Tax=Brachybacterium vulturis TaxID=2017484 RepID=UPI0037362059
MQSSFENTGMSQGSSPDPETELRRRALGNLQARRGLVVQLAVYLLINGILFWTWGSNGFGFPWPLFVLVFWGIGLFWQAWSLFGPGESEDRVRKEMDRLRGAR